jgi:hypothetical protein
MLRPFEFALQPEILFLPLPVELLTERRIEGGELGKRQAKGEDESQYQSANGPQCEFHVALRTVQDSLRVRLPRAL